MAYLMAALGGVLGALARWGVGTALPHSPDRWPWATLLVNLTGCLALGVLLGAVFAVHPDHPWLRPFLGTGVLGGYTTFSTFAVETVQLADSGAWATAGGYVAASVLGGVLAAATGVVLGRRLTPRPVPLEAEVAVEEDVA
ncbi:fluoride efflux transporter CrcB [Geodermatophilus sp. SYSU D00079]